VSIVGTSHVPRSAIIFAVSSSSTLLCSIVSIPVRTAARIPGSPSACAMVLRPARWASSTIARNCSSLSSCTL
jgi:hypothetical protein